MQHGRAHVVPVDDRQVFGLEQLAGVGIDGLEHLGVLVVDHRLGGVDVAVDERGHVEVLLHESDIALGVETNADEAGEELELVAESPVPHQFALEVGRAGDAGVSERHLQGAAALEHLGDVGDVQALLAGHQSARHPRDGEVGCSGIQDRGRHDVDSAVDDGHLEAHVLIEPEITGCKETGELRLRNPLELERYVLNLHGLWLRLGRRCRRRRGRRRRRCWLACVIVVVAAGHGNEDEGKQHREQTPKCSFGNGSFSHIAPLIR